MRFRQRAPLLFVALVAGFSVHVESRLTEHRRRVRPAASGTMDLDVEVSTANGKQARLGALLKPPVTVVVFWATWCQACVAEMPLMARAHREIEGVSFVGINLDADERSFVDYMATHDLPFASVRDPDGRIPYAVGLQVLPTLVVVTAQGRILETVEGGVPGSEISLYAGRWLTKAAEAKEADR